MILNALTAVLASAQPVVEAGELNTEGLISDLAFIMLLGGAVTLLFKKIKQPVVLGYIVAGFLASPNFEYLPSVTTQANIDFWAELGIVIMLFSLGLEFSFKKLLNVGGSAGVTTVIIVCGMSAVGFIIGKLWGFSTINCMFLGGMISMSSTTIILKAFNDLGLRQKKFASLVFGVLIVEDLVAVLLMVILSSIAINNSVEGSELLYSVAKLAFFLIIWTVVGVYLLPSFLNSVRRHLNSETLLVVSIGLCLGMAVFSVMCGFSLALGAFVMGSVLAGTSMAERIEHVTRPVKDLFGAVFFISVGMMVSPDALVQYWRPILILSCTVICGGIIFGTTGMLATGQSLRIAIESGFSLTQIGEFSFIIATLGLSLGVIAPALYPIVVAVSVLTTFTTPYMIRAADPAYAFIERHLPSQLHFLIDRYTATATTANATTQLWKSVLSRYMWRVVLYSIVLIAMCLISRIYLMPWLLSYIPEWGRLLGIVITLGGMSPFLLALSLPASQRMERLRLKHANARFDVPLMAMTAFRWMLTAGFIVYVLSEIYSLRVGLTVGLVILCVIVLLISTRIHTKMRSIESKFINNLNERDLRRSGRNNNVISNLHLAYMTVGYGCPFVGERLLHSNIRQHYGVNLVGIQRGGEGIALPSGETRIFPHDVIAVVGTDEQIQRLLPIVEAAGDHTDDGGADPANFKLTAITLGEQSPLLGKSAVTSNLRRDYKALILALQRGDGEFVDIDGNERFAPGDVVWVVGDPHMISVLNA